MNKKYTFNIDFNENIEDLWQTAICRYLNKDQYLWFVDEAQKVKDEFNKVMFEILQKASDNTIDHIEAELQKVVTRENIKTLEDFDKIIERDSHFIDGPADWTSYANERDLKQFCINYPDIAKKYIDMNEVE